MNIIFKLSSLLFFLAQSEVAFADGAILYDASNFVTQSNEQRLLNAVELKSVDLLRKKQDQFKAPTVLTINRASLEGGLITLAVPSDGKQYQFVGKIRYADGTKDAYWSGKDQSGATFAMSDSNDGAYGVLRDADKIFEIFALPGKRFFVIVESVRHPMEEPTSEGSAAKNQRK